MNPGVKRQTRWNCSIRPRRAKTTWSLRRQQAQGTRLVLWSWHQTDPKTHYSLFKIPLNGFFGLIFFFVKIGKPILRFIGNHKGSPKGKQSWPPQKGWTHTSFQNLLQNDSNQQHVVLAWDRHGDHGKRAESQEMNSHVHSPLIPNRMPNQSMGKGRSFQQMVLGKLAIHRQWNEAEPSPCTTFTN